MEMRWRRMRWKRRLLLSSYYRPGTSICVRVRVRVRVRLYVCVFVFCISCFVYPVFCESKRVAWVQANNKYTTKLVYKLSDMLKTFV